MSDVEDYDNKILVLDTFIDLLVIDRLKVVAMQSAVVWGYSALELDAA